MHKIVHYVKFLDVQASHIQYGHFQKWPFVVFSDSNDSCFVGSLQTRVSLDAFLQMNTVQMIMQFEKIQTINTVTVCRMAYTVKQLTKQRMAAERSMEED